MEWVSFRHCSQALFADPKEARGIGGALNPSGLPRTLIRRGMLFLGRPTAVFNVVILKPDRSDNRRRLRKWPTKHRDLKAEGPRGPTLRARNDRGAREGRLSEPQIEAYSTYAAAWCSASSGPAVVESGGRTAASARHCMSAECGGQQNAAVLGLHSGTGLSVQSRRRNKEPRRRAGARHPSQPRRAAIRGVSGATLC